jgi:hypothetical protein
MADRAKQRSSSTLSVIDGGRKPLTAAQREAVSELTEVVRALPPEQLEVLLGLVEQIQRENYLEKIRPYDVPVIKVLAEVVSGWEPDGVYEFARAWVSTLISRQDGFSWPECNTVQKDEHRRKVVAEMTRRGIFLFAAHPW